MTTLLQTERFEAAYGTVPVVRGVSLAIAAGEVVALLGRNGMGKTTLLRGLMGLTPVRGGTVMLSGLDITRAPPEAIARAGIGYVPAGREIFGSLSVRENLVMCARPAPDGSRPWTSMRSSPCFRGSLNASTMAAASCPAASNKCSRSGAR